MESYEKGIKARFWAKLLLRFILILFIAWVCFAFYENYRVEHDKRPLVCLNMHKVEEDNDEYAYLCHGLLYKYKEYYYIKDDTMSAREITMFFKDFVRDNTKY